MLYTLMWMESPAWMATCEWHLQLSIAHLVRALWLWQGSSGKASPTNNDVWFEPISRMDISLRSAVSSFVVGAYGSRRRGAARMQPRLPAHWAAENWPETAFWASPGHGRRMLYLGGISAVLDCVRGC